MGVSGGGGGEGRWVTVLKVRLCSLWHKIFPVRVDPIFEGFCHPGK